MKIPTQTFTRDDVAVILRGRRKLLTAHFWMVMMAVMTGVAALPLFVEWRFTPPWLSRDILWCSKTAVTIMLAVLFVSSLPVLARYVVTGCRFYGLERMYLLSVTAIVLLPVAVAFLPLQLAHDIKVAFRRSESRRANMDASAQAERS